MKVKLGHLRYKQVKSLKEAKDVVVNYIKKNELRNSEWYSARGAGNIYINKEAIARISYNGRMWDLNEKEIDIEKQIEPQEIKSILQFMQSKDKNGSWLEWLNEINNQESTFDKEYVLTTLLLWYERYNDSMCLKKYNELIGEI